MSENAHASALNSVEEVARASAADGEGGLGSYSVETGFVGRFAHHDPCLAPATEGAALGRVLRCLGALDSDAALAQLLDGEAPDSSARELQEARHALEQSALSAGASPASANHNLALRHAQNALADLHARALARADEVAALDGWQKLGMGAWTGLEQLAPVDVSTVVATFTCPQQQVLATIAFAPAPGATGYRLLETRATQDGDEFEESSVPSLAPVFRNVRFAAGERRFRIQSRNAYSYTYSREFTIEFPARP
jgi:hypothetical protein